MLLENFFIPNGITLYWYNPSRGTNAEIFLTLFVIGISQSSLRRLNLVMYFVFPILSIQSSILGMGKESFFTQTIDLSVIGAHPI